MNKDRVLVLGRGFLGKQFEKNGFKVLGRDDFNFDPNLHYSDLSSFECLGDLDSYDVIVNTVGKANTRWCEKPENWKELFKVNSELPHLLSDHAEKYDKKLVHISTGCVYDQNNRAQTEEDGVVSHVRYVVSKLNGEYGCNLERDLIIRPRLFFGESEDKNNLLNKVRKFNSYLTEINSFTSVQTIVGATIALLENDQSGVFNVANKGYTSLWNLCNSIGLRGDKMDGEQLRSQENLHLVNNIMDTSKLEEFYDPPEIFSEFKRCNQSLPPIEYHFPLI